MNTSTYVIQTSPEISFNTRRTFQELMKPRHNVGLSGLLCMFFLSNLSRAYTEGLSPPAPKLPLLTPTLPPPNPRLLVAYRVLHAWKLKLLIFNDPKKFTSNWHGQDVCNYNGVLCAPAPDDPKVMTVAGIDLNNGNILGELPEGLGYLSDLAFFHINSNRFYGTLPLSLYKMRLLYELDVSNNQFSGYFPEVVLTLPSLKYLDLRFNNFKGAIPTKLFDLSLDAIFLNNNEFQYTIPQNIGNSPASVIVLANNKLTGHVPSSLAKMTNTLDEIILMNSGLTGCLPPELASLKNLAVFDISSNQVVGSLPETMWKLKGLEQLNVASNKLSGQVPVSLCTLPNLYAFVYADNFFYGQPPSCFKVPEKNDTKNCIPNWMSQRSPKECETFLSHPVSCM